MGENSAIEWTDHSLSFWFGCTNVSLACDHCYAEAMSKRFGWAKWGHGEQRIKSKTAIETAFALDRKAAKLGVRHKVFANHLSDLFDTEVPDAWRDEAFAVMALTPHLTWLVLTKRPKVMRAYMLERWQGTPAQTILGIKIAAGGETGRRGQIEEACQPFLDKLGLADPSTDELWTEDGKCRAMQWEWPLPNVWLGTTAEDRKMADLRIPDLLATPAAKRFLSCEPLLGPIDLSRWIEPTLHCSACGAEYGVSEAVPDPKRHPHGADICSQCRRPNCMTSTWGEDALRQKDEGEDFNEAGGEWDHGYRLHWIITGGESGPHARPMELAWARSLIAQCKAAAVPVFMKQLGSATGFNLHDRKGGDWMEWAADLRVREFPI